MAQTVTTGLFVPELLTDALPAAFAGMDIFDGTGAAAYDTSMNGADAKGGKVVTIPYFNAMTAAADVTEGNPLVPEALTESSETATIIHSGKAVDMTWWARIAAAAGPKNDPYQEAARQIAIIMKRRFEAALLTASTASLPGGNVIAATAATFTDVNALDLQALFGDEQDDMAMYIMHSKVWNDVRKLKGSDGHSIVRDKVREGDPRLLLGVPVKISDKATVIAGSPNTYETLLVKKGALALFTQSGPRVRVEGDALTDSDVFAVHAYFAAHRYIRPPGSSKPGVAKITTN